MNCQYSACEKLIDSYLSVTHLSQSAICIVESMGFNNGSGLFDNGRGLAPCKGRLSSSCSLVVESCSDLDTIICCDFGFHGRNEQLCLSSGGSERNKKNRVCEGV